MRGSTAGLDGVLLRPDNKSYHWIFLEFLDMLFLSVVLGPAVVSYWRGTWNLMAHYLYPDDLHSSAIASLVIGIAGHLLFTIFQQFFRQNFNPNKHRITYYFISRFYTYLFGIVCINGWRGGWMLIDRYTPHRVIIVFTITFICILILMLLKSLRNISAAPFALATDNYKEYFDIPTMFKISGTRDPGLYVLDCLFSVLVIGSLVVFVWRGLWVLLDLTLFPGDPALSAFGSLAIGYGVVGVTFALQPLMRWACERLHGFWRVLVADCFLFFSFIGTVNVWRGVWQLLDIYFLPDNTLLSDWITHGVSIILLILLNCSNSVLVRGVYIDAEEPAGQCVIFPVYYIRLFFQKERTKKQKRLNDNNIKKTAATSDQHNNTLLLIDYDKRNNVLVKNNLSAIPPSSTMHVTGDKATILCSNFSNTNNTQSTIIQMQKPEINNSSTLDNNIDDDDNDDEKNASDEHTNLCTEN